jgi:nucleoside-triphosphatase THEP1
LSNDGMRILYDLGIVSTMDYAECMASLPDAVENVAVDVDWKSSAGFPAKYHECDAGTLGEVIMGHARNWWMSEQLYFTITGKVGTGKTWAACALAYRIRDRQRQIVRFATTPDIIDIFRACSMGDEKAQAKKMLLMAADVLVLDDVGANRTNDFALEALYNIVNRGKRLIVTTNLSRDDVTEKIDSRISSRLWGGYVVEWNQADRRTENSAERIIRI